MFGMNPMAFMPLGGNMVQQLTPEQTAQMQRLALQNQQLQLKQMKQMLEQYAQSIDAALEQIEGQFARLEKGEAVLAQVQVQAMPQAQALAQRLELGQRVFAQRFDRLDEQLRLDQQSLYVSGMGDFGRPVF